MATQQPHVKVTSPAAAHTVNTNMMARPCKRLCIWHARCATPYMGERKYEKLSGSRNTLFTPDMPRLVLRGPAPKLTLYENIPASAPLVNLCHPGAAESRGE